MKKSYIIIILAFLVIGLGIIIGVVASNKTVSYNQDLENRLAESENTLDNEIELVTTSVLPEEDEEEHYVIRDCDGYVYVYLVNKDGKEELREITEIVTTYLPETDRIALNEGIKVIGKEKLNAVLEDYE